MNTLQDILCDIWEFSEGLNKTCFNWQKLPKEVTVLAGTDTSGIVRHKGREYYVCHEWQTNAIIIESN